MSRSSKNGVKTHRHWLVFSADSQETQVAVWAQCGLSTRAIASKANITVAQAQYRISKAQRAVGAKFRADYRNGSELAYAAADFLAPRLRKVIMDTVAPKFMPLAAEGVLKK